MGIDSSNNARIIRLFLSSPDDVRHERDIVESVIDCINPRITKRCGVYIKLFRWENDVMPAMGRPQSIINEQVGEYEIFVGIMWIKFGDKKGSGTEEEFRIAYNRWQSYGLPHILFYFKEKSYHDKDSVEFVEQRKRVLEFQTEMFEKGIVKKFSDDDSFRRQLKHDLGEVIDIILGESEFEPQRKITLYKEVNIFQNHPLPDHPRLVGRKRQSYQLRKRLLDRETSVIVVSGMAGIGKTALISNTIKKVSSKFDEILYFEVTDKSNFHSFLHDLSRVAISFFINKQENKQSELELYSNLSLKQLITFILNYLADRKIVLIVDNFENLLNKRGKIQDNSIYTFFESFLKFESLSKICLVSRMKPKLYPDNFRKMKCISLGGLNIKSTEKLLKSLGLKDIDESKAKEFSRVLGGNPQILKIFYYNNKHYPMDEMLQYANAVRRSLDTLLSFIDTELEPIPRNILLYLSIFRRFPSYEMLFKLFGNNSDTFDALEDLQNRCLITSTSQSKLVRMHQSLHRYFELKIDSANKQEINQKIGLLYSEDILNKKSLDGENVKRILEAIYHLRESNNKDDVEKLIVHLLEHFPNNCNFQDLETIFNLSQEFIASQSRSLFFQKWAETLEKVGAWQQVDKYYKNALDLLESDKIKERALLHLKLSQAYILKNLNLSEAKNSIAEAKRLLEMSYDNYLASLYKLCEAYYLFHENKWESALNILNANLFQPYHQKNFTYIDGDSCRIAGVIYKNQCIWDKSVEMLQRAIKIFNCIGNEFFLSMAQHNLAGTYRRMKMYDYSIDLLRKSIEIKKRIGDLYGLARCHRGLAKILIDLKEFDEAEIEIRKGMELRKQLQDLEGIALDQQQLAFIEEGKENWDKSREFLNKVLDFFKGISNEIRIAEMFSTIGFSYYKSREYKTAIEYFNKAADRFKQMPDDFRLSTCYYRMGECNFLIGNIEKAEYYLIDAIGLLSPNDRPIEYTRAKTFLGEIYKKMDKIKLSKECFKEADQVKAKFEKNYKIIIGPRNGEKANRIF